MCSCIALLSQSISVIFSIAINHVKSSSKERYCKDGVKYEKHEIGQVVYPSDLIDEFSLLDLLDDDWEKDDLKQDEGKTYGKYEFVNIWILG